MRQSVSFWVAFFGGLLSFISPCVFPLVPAYLAYMAGISLEDADQGKIRKLTFVHSCFFILGFSIIFVILGASASLLGKLLFIYKDLIRQVGGIVIMIFGLYIMGILKIPFLDAEKRIQLRSKPAGFAGSVLVGVAFAAGWTPCVGPILGSILLLAGTSTTVWQGIVLLIMYSLGLGIPFILISLTLNTFLAYFDKIRKCLGVINFISGAFLIALGILLIVNG